MTCRRLALPQFYRPIRPKVSAWSPRHARSIWSAAHYAEKPSCHSWLARQAIAARRRPEPLLRIGLPAPPTGLLRRLVGLLLAGLPVPLASLPLGLGSLPEGLAGLLRQAGLVREARLVRLARQQLLTAQPFNDWREGPHIRLVHGDV
jgi:hypothetical protein